MNECCIAIFSVFPPVWDTVPSPFPFWGNSEGTDWTALNIGYTTGYDLLVRFAFLLIKVMNIRICSFLLPYFNSKFWHLKNIFVSSLVGAMMFAPFLLGRILWDWILIWCFARSEHILQCGLLGSRWWRFVYRTQKRTRAVGNEHLKPINADCCLYATAWSINIFVWNTLRARMFTACRT